MNAYVTNNNLATKNSLDPMNSVKYMLQLDKSTMSPIINLLVIPILITAFQLINLIFLKTSSNKVNVYVKINVSVEKKVKYEEQKINTKC